jgi:hypothetical protein
VNKFGSNGQKHAVLGLMECLHPALHDGPYFERIDWEIVKELKRIWIDFGQKLCM